MEFFKELNAAQSRWGRKQAGARGTGLRKGAGARIA